MKVLFNRTDEFLAEVALLAKQGLHVEPIARVTWKHRHSPADGMTYISLCAAIEMGNNLLLLEDHLFSQVSAILEAKGLPASAVELMKRLRHHLSEAGFVIRGGLCVS